MGKAALGAIVTQTKSDARRRSLPQSHVLRAFYGTRGASHASHGKASLICQRAHLHDESRGCTRWKSSPSITTVLPAPSVATSTCGVAAGECSARSVQAG